MRAFPVEARTRITEDPLIVDITREVADAVRESSIDSGICCVYSLRTTCAVRVNEFEAGLVNDLASLFNRLVPRGTHDYSNGRHLAADNEHAGEVALRDSRGWCLSILFGPAGETIPVANGELCLGTWQRVLFLEFERESSGEPPWLVQVVGRADRSADIGSCGPAPA